MCRQVSNSRYPRCADGSKNTVSRGLRAEDVARFNAFGFLALRGLRSRNEAEALRAECEQLTFAENPGWNGTTAAGVHGLCEKGERHARLLDDDRVHDIPHKLLGHDFLYEGSACSWYDGDTPWHGGSGAVTWTVPHIKVAFYLDDLGPDDGCLRVQVALSFLAKPRTPQQIAYLHSRSGWGGLIGAPRALLESGSERRRRMAQGLVDVGLEIR